MKGSLILHRVYDHYIILLVTLLVANQAIPQNISPKKILIGQV